MSRSSRPVSAAGNNRILTIDWMLLWRRLRSRSGQLFSSARHRAANTEYIPPAWMGRFRLTWFRIGLIALALFVVTQKQIDFTVSVGKKGLAATSNSGRVYGSPNANGTAITTSGADEQRTSTLSVLPTGSSPAPAARPAWNVNQYDAATVRAYVNRFERVAQTEENKFGIPVPAKLAMAILASSAGERPAVKSNNNHFGPVTANGYYDNAWSNWRAHSELIDREYPQLAHEGVNHQQWIAALAKTNYSNDPNYSQKLLEIISRFGLDRL